MYISVGNFNYKRIMLFTLCELQIKVSFMKEDMHLFHELLKEYGKVIKIDLLPQTQRTGFKTIWFLYSLFIHKKTHFNIIYTTEPEIQKFYI